MKYFYTILILIYSGINGFSQTPALPDTVMACHADSIMLDAGEGFLSYSWNTGDTTQTIYVDSTAIYDVILVGDTIIFDTVYVNIQNVSIIQEDTIICYKVPFEICVDVDTLMYLWTSDDPDLVIEFDTAACIEVMPELDTTIFYVAVSDSLNINTCIDSITIYLHPRMVIEELNQINTGCPGTCKGQMEVIVSGGLPPYTYLWLTSPKQHDSIAFGLCESDYKLTITDANLCPYDTMVHVKVFDMPEVEIIVEPEDDIYIQNPIVDFSFDNLSIDSIQVIDWNWNFGDSTYSSEETPQKVFDHVRVYDVWLKYTTSDECIDSVSVSIDIKEVELTIPNIFTPNGDEYNQVFEIKNLEHYMSNELLVFNRYGKRVYSRNNYLGDWDGDNLKDGVYFYVLRAKGFFGTDVFRGSVTIMR